MPHEKQPAFIRILGLAFVAMLAVMLVFELTKQLINPDISIWESHTITILFTSIIAVIILFFPLRSLCRQQERTRQALMLQLGAEEKLRQSEAQYRSFVESVEDSIYTVDTDLRYLLINARHLARQGLSPEVYTGKHYGDFHSKEETRIFSEQVQQIIETKHPLSHEYEHDGKFFLRKLNPVIDPVSNRVIAITVISSDMTDHHRAEKNLADTNRKLNLLNDITRHDIFNQLTVLNSYLSLSEELTQDTTIKKYLLKSEHVSETIHAQILFARDYQTIGVESPQWQNVHVAIQHARMSIRVPDVFIHESCSQTEIFADPLLEKVFYNLMDNALRYAGPAPVISFQRQQDGNEYLILCEDNGPGIPREEKNHLFSHGYGRNTGLGLFLIREILAITTISIQETGEPGKGSRFEIRIPKGAYRIAPHPE